MCATYSVVHFYIDETVEAVPSYWVKGDFCAWPTNKNCVSKFIQNKHIVAYLKNSYNVYNKIVVNNFF